MRFPKFQNFRNSQPPSPRTGPSTGARFARGFFGILPSIFTAALLVDTYNGQKENTQIRVSQSTLNADWKVMMERQGQWSGYPWMDAQTERAKELLEYGPWNLKEKYEHLKIRIDSFVWRVLYPNTIPIAISIAALYMGFGAKVLHAPFKAFAKGLSHTPGGGSFGRGAGKAVGAVIKTTAKGVGRVVSIPFKSVYHLGFSLLAGLMALFALDRFQAAYTDEAQEQFFDPLVWTPPE
jgi:hypothetical protein